MIRRSANALVGNNRQGCQRSWEVVASRFFPSSRNGDQQQQLHTSSSAAGSYSSRDGRHRECGNAKYMVRDGVTSSSRLEDVPLWPTREGRLREQFCITGRTNHRGWVWIPSSLPVGYSAAEYSSSGWRLGRYQRSSLLEPWKSGSIMLLSTKPKIDNDRGHESSGEKETLTEEKASVHPKTIDDFQHEEIVGPTVERDMSDTANQLRTSLGELTTFMANLKTGFLLLGGVQLLAAIWSSSFHGAGLIVGLSQDLAFVLSFILAYLLRYFESAVRFFSRTEERGRMRILTLSLQVTKMVALLFYRSNFVVKAVAFGSVLTLLGDIWVSYLSVL